jgi:hypothetical protein
MIITIPAAVFGLCSIFSSPTAQPGDLPLPSQPIFPTQNPLEDLPGAAISPVSGAINVSLVVCNPLGEQMFIGPIWPAVSAGSWIVGQPPVPVPSLVAVNLRSISRS